MNLYNKALKTIMGNILDLKINKYPCPRWRKRHACAQVAKTSCSYQQSGAKDS
jgi:hypothetical protein